MRYFRINKILLLAALLLLAACTPRSIILSIPPDINSKIAEANASVCAYKGRVSVIYDNGKEDVRFKGLLNKDCKDNFRLKILGFFNTVAYDVRYTDGVVEAYEKGEDVSLEMDYFMRSKGLDNMVSLIRYPHVKIDNSFKVKAVMNEYILTKGPVTVAAGQDFLINSITFGSTSFTYSYTDGKLTQLVYKDADTSVEIKLR
ncbi:MAG: hypothetical protein C0602_05355 [Denitrovibrio sp.]|nr:MAG: hypothetical protein C0602_05355 [Denitrovibrio sp.]